MADGKNQFSISVNPDSGKISADIKQKYDQTKRGLRLIMWRALGILESSIISNIRRNFNVRTGTLMNSVSPTKEVTMDGEEVTGVIGSYTPYSAVHEFGKVITPVRAKNLWIPTRNNQAADGMPLKSISDFWAHPRHFFHKGSAMIDEGSSKAPLVKTLFILRKSVEIKPRPYIRPAFEKNKDRIAKTFGLFLEDTWSSKK